MLFPKVFWLALPFRLINAYLVITYFDPDEYWQSLEIAHATSFGYGWRTWEWMPGVRIRGGIHPLIFAAYYNVLRFTGLDSRFLVAYGPRILQGVMTFATDVAGFNVARKYFDDKLAGYFVFCQSINWFYFYCASRTYSNSIETMLTLFALYYWPIVLSKSEARSQPRNRPQGSLTWALVFAAASVLVRPSSAALWIFVGTLHVVWVDQSKQSIVGKLMNALRSAIPVGAFAVLVSLLVDKWMYNDWTFVPWNFFYFNVVENISAEYGTHRWWWYILECIPTMLTTQVPLLAYGLWSNTPARVLFLKLILAWNVFHLSLLPHKELRFMLPMLPILLMFVANGMLKLQQRWGLQSVLYSSKLWVPENQLEQLKIKHKVQTTESRNKKMAQVMVLCVVLPNCIAAYYFSRWHQQGPLAVMDFLASEPAEILKSIDVITNCHSTPMYSHLHRDVPFRFLDCSPPVEALRNLNGYNSWVYNDDGLDESTVFQNDPFTFVTDRINDDWQPTHIVVFSNQVNANVSSYLQQQRGYAKCASMFHTIGTTMDVYCTRS